MSGPELPSALVDWGIFFRPGSRVVALPSWRRPRLLLPADTLSERLSGSAFYPAFRRTGQLYRWVLRLRAVVGRGVDRAAADGAPLLREFLDDVLPDARVRAVQVGIPGTLCKLTAQLVDETGRAVGYLKCAHLPLARERLRHEFELLRLLPPAVGPLPIKFGTLGRSDALLLGAVCGTTPPAEAVPSVALRRFCASLVGTIRHELSHHPWLAAHPDTAGASAPMLEALADRTWPVAIQHGDLAPWNLIQNGTEGIAAVDWEFGSSAGFPGLDLAQYILQVAVLVTRASPRSARALAVRELLQDGGLAISPREAAALVGLAARQAYENALVSGSAPGFWVQEWRRRVWECGLHA